MKLVAAGQALIEHPPLAPWGNDLFALRDVLRSAGLALANLEVALQGSSHSWPMTDGLIHVAPASVLDWLRDLGFNGLSLANNHTGDLGPESLMAEHDVACGKGFISAGAGRDPSAAAAAAFGGRPDAPVALIAASAAYGRVAGSARAGQGELPSRPGVNGVAVRRVLDAEPELFRALQRFVEVTGHAGRVERDVSSGRRKSLTEG